MTRLLLTLLVSFVPLAKSQDAVVLAEVKVPLTETTYFCYDKAVTGFNPPYDKSVDFKETKFTGQWLPVGEGESAGFRLKSEGVFANQFFFCKREGVRSAYDCDGELATKIRFNTATLKGVRANMAGYINEGGSAAISVFKCEEF